MSDCHARLGSPRHRANLRAWATFRRACGNELVVDAALMRSLGMTALLPNVIPRPIPVSRRLSRVKPAWPWLFATAAALWAGLLFPLFMLKQIVRTVLAGRGQPRRTEPLMGDVAVVLTARMGEVVRCVPAERRPQQWLTMPWQPVSLTASDGEAASLLSFARSTDLWQAAWLAWRAVRIVHGKGLGPCPGGQCRTAILQTYIAWEWFLTWQVLPQAVSPTSGLWYANHYDRWAVLLDRLPAGGRRCLVQHGFAREVPLPYRQCRVSEVFYFDQGTRRILQGALRPTCQPRWTAMQARLKLTPLEDAQRLRSLGVQRRPTVLMIGQPVEPDLERELLSLLARELPDVVLLYKAHPLYGRSGAAHVPAPPVQIVWDRNLFPAADVVLSGGSWLGVEYESTGTPVVWYKTRPLAELPAWVRAELNQTAARLEAA
jgi:hypothetical protein